MTDQLEAEASAPVANSSRESQAAAGWHCQQVGTFTTLLPRDARPFSWLSPVPLVQARNDPVARKFGDPTNEERRRWVAAQLVAGVDPDFRVTTYADRKRISFLVLGDTGEGDGSQYCVVPGLLKAAEDAVFLFIASDVIYPAGGINEYRDKFYRPYRDFPGPIYAVPGNHDWYDGLTGFMLHFCGADGSGRGSAGPTPGGAFKRFMRKLLWRNPEKGDGHKLAEMRAMRARTEQQARQPGPYLAIEAGPLLLVGIDTGITSTIDRDHGEWLQRVSRASPKPKILLTGKPLLVDATPKPGTIEGTATTVDEIVRDPQNNYLAAIGGDIHNYQRYPVLLDDGRTIQYIVSGGGGAFMHGTHKIPRVDLAGVKEAEFRCYPRRGDSLSIFSVIYQRRFGRLIGKVVIPPDQAAALMGERLGITPTRESDREVVITPESRRAFEKVFPRRDRAHGPLHQYFQQLFDWNEPPMFKSFLRIDASQDEVLIRCFAATGCLAQEEAHPVEDIARCVRDDAGHWQWQKAAV
jgi:hypothetical protein